ncbi:MAG: methyltransferase [Candidatus Amoebophilus sp. 36-38]|nr:MAG: methyltransferase [Candidatus Amoebophilus sp. 36-38]
MTTSYTSIHQYAEAYTTPESPLLAKINQETQAEVQGAHMIAGHLQGRILATFSHMIKPKRILEIGTYTGYSALCLAEGLDQNGILYTVDSDLSLYTRVKKYFEASDKADQIKYYIGQALEIIPQIHETFDLVFIDADKKNYANYYDLVVEKLSPDGFMIIDNVLWKGKVVGTEDQSLVDKQTQRIIDFNNKVQNDPRTTHVLFPIRDGLMVVRKK